MYARYIILDSIHKIESERAIPDDLFPRCITATKGAKV